MRAYSKAQGCLVPKSAPEIAAQIAAGLRAVRKPRIVQRDTPAETTRIPRRIQSPNLCKWASALPLDLRLLDALQFCG